MLQDIFPNCLKNEYIPRVPRSDDYVMIYHENRMLFRKGEVGDELLKYQEVKAEFGVSEAELLYLFTVDEIAFYLVLKEIKYDENFTCQPVQMHQKFETNWFSFAVSTAYHLAYWYDHSRFCGKCGHLATPKIDERAMECFSCGEIKFPTISPAIIVGITDGEEILLTKYKNGHGRYALVAGYSEIGENLEETVRREVVEEVGLKVKNLRYYDSQPWGYSQSMLVGYFAELDGAKETIIDTNELSVATWFKRDEIPVEGTQMSLTRTMIEAFRNGLV